MLHKIKEINDYKIHKQIQEKHITDNNVKFVNKKMTKMDCDWIYLLDLINLNE